MEIQGNILCPGTAILTEVGKTRPAGIAMGPSTATPESSRAHTDTRSNYAVRKWHPEEILVHLGKACSDQALASPGFTSETLRMMRTGEAELQQDGGGSSKGGELSPALVNQRQEIQPQLEFWGQFGDHNKKKRSKPIKEPPEEGHEDGIEGNKAG